METVLRRTRGISAPVADEYELSVYLDLRHLGSLCDTYIRGYGEELPEEKLNRLVADLLLGVFSNTACSNGHRWLGRFFADGFFFIQKFEEEAKKTLRFAIPLWREYEPESVEVTIEHNLASTFIGFRNMFEGVNTNTLVGFSDDDAYISKRLDKIFDQDVIIDFRNNTIHQIYQEEITSIGSGRVTWAYLIEESMRINQEVLRRNPSTRFGTEELMEFIDVDEMRSRFESSDLMSRLLIISDAMVAESVFDNMVVDLAGIISRILISNSATLTMVVDQLTKRAEMMGITGTVTIHCTDFSWMGYNAIVKVGVFKIDANLLPHLPTRFAGV